MSATIGAFTFVLHSHLPYARLAGRWPHGEEWIHEAATETYIPLLKTLYDLKAEGVPYRVTLGITPTLAEQLTDTLVLENINRYLGTKQAAAEQDIDKFAHQPEVQNLARWYVKLFQETKATFNDQFGGELIPHFRQLQDEGYIELIASVATHAYMPLLAEDSTVFGQIRQGIASYERTFGRRPRALWLPECGYRPAIPGGRGDMRPGLEHFLAAEGIQVFFTETHTITGGEPVGVAAGDVIGPNANIKNRYVLPSENKTPERVTTTYEAYYVNNSAANPTLNEHSGVAVLGRNNNSGQQVWSAEWGYPGDFDYREFHKKAGTSGLQYWRVTGDEVGLAHKDIYRPDWARYKVDQHAEHFAHLVWDLLREYNADTGKYGIVSSNYDTELFGHWWFEGVQWLGKVLRHLSQNDEIDMVTASQYVEEHPPQQVLNLMEGSWGTGGGHFTWQNGETGWMWPLIHEAERRMVVLVQNFQSPTDDELFVLNQAARELLLMQSSDWQFLITTDQAKEYAIQRFSQHMDRFNKLADSIDAQTPDRELAEELWERDKIFPDINYQWFRGR